MSCPYVAIVLSIHMEAVMQIHREAKPTFTPFELDKGDELIFQRADGSEVTIELISTSASIIEQGPACHRVDYLQIAA